MCMGCFFSLMFLWLQILGWAPPDPPSGHIDTQKRPNTDAELRTSAFPPCVHRTTRIYRAGMAHGWI